jgi:hypothetical protein
MSIIQGTSKASSGSYQIDQSCRFNDNDSAFTAWTPGGVGDSSKIFTINMWVKRANLGISTDVFTAGLPVNDSNYCHISFDTSDRIIVRNRVAVAFPIDFTTTAVYRDPSAWLHIHLACDTTQASATDGFKLTVNGVRVTSFALSTYTQNSEFWFSKANLHRVGRASNSYSLPYYDGYLSEMRYIDGIQKEPTDFGETNADGVWVPIEYTGAYGTNGFYLDFSNSSDFGSDQSGNGNDFTDSGLTTNDQVTDSPTNNFCTLNPLFSHSSCTFSNGNLDVTLPGAGTGYSGAAGSFGVTSGKWYWEVTPNNTVQAAVGILTSSYPANKSTPDNPSTDGYLAYMYRTTGTLMTSASWDPGTAYGATYTTADVIGIALDLDAGTPTIEFFKNNTSQGSSNIVAGTWLPGMIRYDNGPTYTTNFGQSGFTYTPPTGFLELNTANLPEPTIKDGSAYFQTTLYTGNGTAIGSGGNAISQSGNSTFQPDFAWIKSRSAATDNALYDAVRGTTKELISNTAASESTLTEGLTTFGTAGFTVGSDAAVNTNTSTYVAWQWKAGGAGSSNTDGSITSTVSANPTAGFSIVTYTGTGANATVGHGLGVAPKMVIVRERSPGSDDWYVYHMGLTSASYSLFLNTTAAQSGPSAAYWNSTAPTSSVFSLGTSVGVNQNTATYVAYCFADVEGFSKFGKYTGNGSANGPMVNCGFRPAYIMIKRVSGGVPGAWSIYDTARMTGNGPGISDQELTADTAAAEPVSTLLIDILSNGFKPRTAIQAVNVSATPLIYMAFAEHPFGGENTAPATAR